MGGGLLQLVAYGGMDVYLTAKPQVTLFKAVYRRTTNFALEAIQQTINGTADFGRQFTVTVSRNGDLIWKTYLQIGLPAMSQTGGGTCAWTRYIGHQIINEIDLQIGGQTIDSTYANWLTIWNEITQVAEKEDGYSVMVGNTSALTNTSASSTPATLLYVPLQFWFNRNPGLALPLIALQYHDVKFVCTFNAASTCYITNNGAAPTSGTPVLTSVAMYIDYVYLDTDERRQFAAVAHEYLIEQVQFTGAESFTSANYKQRINFNHPTKFLAWVTQLNNNTANGANRWFDFTDSGTNTSNAYIGNDPLLDGKLQLNGQDRFSVQLGPYFNLVQPYQHFIRIPATGIYLYSFALNPIEHQPSGTCNFSRIDNATLNLDVTSTVSGSQVNLFTYGFNYNILRIMSGLGGLAYSS